jgi:hypothetical protein
MAYARLEEYTEAVAAAFRFLEDEYGYRREAGEDYVILRVLYRHPVLGRGVRLDYERRDDAFSFYLLADPDVAVPDTRSPGALFLFDLYQRCDPSVRFADFTPHGGAWREPLLRHAEHLRRCGADVLSGRAPVQRGSPVSSPSPPDGDSCEPVIS